MTVVSRASALLAAAAPCLSTTAAPAQHAPPEDLAGLVASLNAWLDRESDYPPRDAPVTLVFVDPADAVSLDGYHADEFLQTRGLYDPPTMTIFLMEPWSADRPQDVSFLLHELVHHRQQGARHFYCPGAQEPDAYRLQEAWLSERGHEARINWIAAYIEAGCARRDFHPD